MNSNTIYLPNCVLMMPFLMERLHLQSYYVYVHDGEVVNGKTRGSLSKLFADSPGANLTCGLWAHPSIFVLRLDDLTLPSTV